MWSSGLTFPPLALVEEEEEFEEAGVSKPESMLVSEEELLRGREIGSSIGAAL